MSEPLARTIDQIPHNYTFLAQAYCAISAGFVENKSPDQFEEFFKRMFEEEMRRKTQDLPENTDVKEWMFKLLNVDKKKYIDEPLAKVLGDNSINIDAIVA